MRRVVPLLPLLLLATACNPPAPGRGTTTDASEAGTPEAKEPIKPAVPGGPRGVVEGDPPFDPADLQLADAAALKTRADRFVPVKITADLSGLPESEKATLELLIEASRELDPIFDRQAWAQNPAFFAALDERAKASGAGAAQLEAARAYARIMRGPWDRQDHFSPFAVAGERPPGAGFYPEDLSDADFKAYLEAHEDQRAALEGLFTVVRRKGEGLEAVPYSKAYGAWLGPAATKLNLAAKRTTNESLKSFLELRAEAFQNDDYYASDRAWMDLDSRVEITIGPYEVYEDELAGLKASFESFVTVADTEASAKLAGYKDRLPAMEKNLPIPEEIKTVRGAESPIRVVDLVFASGEARKSVQTIAFNLPNDERVRKEKGAKKVMLRNVIKVKFERIMRPIAEQILDEGQLGSLSADAFFDETLFHELSHSLGPAFTTRNGEKVEVRVALGSSYAALEEGKADVMGAYNVLYMIDEGEFPAEYRKQLLISYFAGLFRSVRFGVAEAHGKGAAFQINRFLEEGAATFDPENVRFKVDIAKLEASIDALVRDICVMQHEGDPKKVKAFLARYGVVSPPMKKALAKVEAVPVDVRPSYPLAGE